MELILDTESVIKGAEISRSSAMALFTLGIVQETKKKGMSYASRL
jgi:hypothetical protein